MLDSIAQEDVFAVHIDNIQNLEVLLDSTPLENPLHLKTMTIGIIVEEDVKDYPHVLPNWYCDTT